MSKYLITSILWTFLIFENSDGSNIESYYPDLTVITDVEKNTETLNGWKTISLKNLSFDLPTSFQLQSAESNNNKKVFANKRDDLIVTIDIANLPRGYEQSDIYDLIPNISEFGETVNSDNRKLFSDFRLLSTTKSKLGNSNSILVSQSSRNVSGKNVSMIVKAYFTISNPNYFSVTFSYPENSYDGSNIINRIANSFRFGNNPSTPKSNKSTSAEPGLIESQNWLIDKLSNYIERYISSTDNMSHRHSFFYDFKKVGIEDGNLVVEYERKSTTRDLLFTGREPLVSIGRFKKTIPFYKIERVHSKYNYFGDCEFSISTEKNAITTINLRTRQITYSSFFPFGYRCNEVEDIGSRLEKAIMHLKEISPKKIKIKKESNEPF